MKKAVLYKKLKKNNVQCLACSWQCAISPGKSGICGVRQNKNGDLYLLVYGRPIAVNIDPVEKKPLFHFLPGKTVFSFGTLGCNFSCGFCQNWDISQTPKLSKKIDVEKKQQKTIEDLILACQKLSPKEIIDYCLKNKISAIAYTYNEPAIFFEYAYDTARLAHKKGLKNIYVSNGFETDMALEKISPYLDAINIDLKAYSPKFYKKICKAKIEPVLNNIKTIAKEFKKTWLEITTLIIPGHNDSPEEIKKIAEFIAKLNPCIPWHISAFYPAYQMSNIQATPTKTIHQAYKIGKKAGLRFVYTGNIYDHHGQNTYCPNCRLALVKRDGYTITDNSIENNRCPKCKENIHGIWT